MLGNKKAVGRLEEDVFRLRRRVDDLESAHKRLSLEWEELYDKVRRQMARMSKRIAVDKKEEANAVPDEAVNDTSIGTDPVSASILRRRGMRARLE